MPRPSAAPSPRLKVKILVTPAHAPVLREYVQARMDGGTTATNLSEAQVCAFLLEIARAIEDAHGHH